MRADLLQLKPFLIRSLSNGIQPHNTFLQPAPISIRSAVILAIFSYKRAPTGYDLQSIAGFCWVHMPPKYSKDPEDVQDPQDGPN